MEIVFVLAIRLVIAGVGLAHMNKILGQKLLTGVARSISNETVATKIRSAAKFTRAGLFVDVTGNSYHIDVPDPSVVLTQHWTADTWQLANTGNTDHIQSTPATMAALLGMQPS